MFRWWWHCCSTLLYSEVWWRYVETMKLWIVRHAFCAIFRSHFCIPYTSIGVNHVQRQIIAESLFYSEHQHSIGPSAFLFLCRRSEWKIFWLQFIECNAFDIHTSNGHQQRFVDKAIVSVDDDDDDDSIDDGRGGCQVNAQILGRRTDIRSRLRRNRNMWTKLSTGGRTLNNGTMESESETK